MNEFLTGAYLLASPEIKRYILTSLFSQEKHLVSDEILKNAFSEENYNKVMSNRHPAWLIEDYFE